MYKRQLNNGGCQLLIGSNINTGSNGLFRFTQSSGNNYIQSGSNGSGGTWAPLVFAQMLSTTEYMRIHSNGYVGINCNAPAYTLDVNGTIRTTAGLVFGVQSI